MKFTAHLRLYANAFAGVALFILTYLCALAVSNGGDVVVHFNAIGEMYYELVLLSTASCVYITFYMKQSREVVS
jgi:hypothetical protein